MGLGLRPPPPFWASNYTFKFQSHPKKYSKALVTLSTSPVSVKGAFSHPWLTYSE